MILHRLHRLGVCAAVLLLAACASVSQQRPVLYPNAAYKAMGENAARAQLDQCEAQARASGLTPSGNQAASGAARGAAVAGVAGAVGNMVFSGGNLEQAVKRGAQGAVVGAAAGGVGGAMSEHGNPVYRQFVQRCASEKGLEIIGWQ